jgi:hypothetical protein
MKILFAFVAVLVSLMPAGTVLGQQKPKEFSLYLLPEPADLKQKYRAFDIGKLKKPVGDPLIAAKDIAHYQKDRHEIGIYYTTGLRLKTKAVDLIGKPFAIFVGDVPIYAGAFWPASSSQSYDGVYIDPSDFQGDFPILKLQFGYPTNKFTTGPDRRADARVFKAFEDAGMLYQELFIRGKCVAMRDTMKRRAGIIYTFSVDSVVKGNYKDSEITFETWADGEYGKLLDALTAKGVPYGDNWAFDKNKEILLKFEQRTDLTKQPRWFWYRAYEEVVHAGRAGDENTTKAF